MPLTSSSGCKKLLAAWASVVATNLLIELVVLGVYALEPL